MSVEQFAEPAAPAWDAPVEAPQADAAPVATGVPGLPDLSLGGEKSTDSYEITALQAAANAATQEIHVLPELEATSAPKAGRVEIIREAGLEPTHGDAGEIHVAADPALLTDPTQMVSEFSTKFGVENPEPVTVGVAEHMVEEAAPAPPAEIAAAAPAASPAAPPVAPAAYPAAYPPAGYPVNRPNRGGHHDRGYGEHGGQYGSNDNRRRRGWLGELFD